MLIKVLIPLVAALLTTSSPQAAPLPDQLVIAVVVTDKLFRMSFLLWSRS